MKAYRITKRKFVDQAWSGYGASVHGGRWNSPGRRAVYCADTPSLALLEILVHLQQSEQASHYTILEIELPDELCRELPPELHPREPAEPIDPMESQNQGDAWLKEADGVALIVPSVIMPWQNNFLLNPTHPAFTDIVSDQTERPFRLDSRLLKGGT